MLSLDDGNNESATSCIPRFLRPTPPAKMTIADPEDVRRAFSRYRLDILVWTTIGYAGFYFVRKNLSIAMPEMERTLGISNQQLGIFLTIHGVLYGVSKFGNGFVSDRCNARVFMAIGLILSAVMNIGFGMTSSAIAMGIFWMFNGWVQGMGYPPCARLLTHWFPPTQLASRMSFWNTSHTVGAAGVLVLCGYLVHWFSWRACFFVPAAIAVVIAMLLLLFLRDTPESVGLPAVDSTPGVAAGEATADAAFLRKVFANPYLWIYSFANFFVYIIRYGLLDWGPKLLNDAKGIEVDTGSWMVASFEISGLIGIILSGWLTDRFFAGRASRMCLAFMLLCGVSVALFWQAPAGNIWLNTLPLMAAGFFIYGPQALIGAAAANLGTKRAAGAAVGLTSIFGYASTTVSGVGFGWLVDHYKSWDAAFCALLIAAALGTFLFAAALPAKAHGYASDS